MIEVHLAARKTWVIQIVVILLWRILVRKIPSLRAQSRWALHPKEDSSQIWIICSRPVKIGIGFILLACRAKGKASSRTHLTTWPLWPWESWLKMKDQIWASVKISLLWEVVIWETITMIRFHPQLINPDSTRLMSSLDEEQKMTEVTGLFLALHQEWWILLISSYKVVVHPRKPQHIWRDHKIEFIAIEDSHFWEGNHIIMVDQDSQMTLGTVKEVWIILCRVCSRSHTMEQHTANNIV